MPHKTNCDFCGVCIKDYIGSNGQCQNCFEVRLRLTEFIKSPKNRAFVNQVMGTQRNIDKTFQERCTRDTCCSLP